MSRHLDKVLAHAERQLAPVGGSRPAELLARYKKFLRIEEHRLRLKHQAGVGGREICGRRSKLVDLLLRHIFASADSFAQSEGQLSATPLTLVALGGYGRGELNPCSDVDVMFLHNEKAESVSPYAAQVIEQILYLLWDIGFKVGHSTRSIPEALAEANSEMLTKTSMLESRFLAGDKELEQLFREEFREKCVQGHEHSYVEARMEDQATRHAKYGNSVYMQEPHVKSGCGGLRDYQNLLWMTFFREGALTTTHLVGKDWLSLRDQRRIDLAYDFLLRLRTELHYVNGRATDVLHLNFQETIAQRMRYPAKGRAPLSEVLMKDYYQHTRNIFRVTERITEQFASGRSSHGMRVFFSFLSEASADEKDLGEFVLRSGQLYAKQSDFLQRVPVAIMQVFETAQMHRADLSPDLEEWLARNPGLVTKTFRYAVPPRQIFKRILSRKGEAGAALRMMHRVDFLGRYIPEFGSLTCLVQHEFFHRYTADEHTLVCLEKLDALTTTADPKLLPYRELFDRIEDPLVLYLALLLHDTGKGVGARPHTEASALFAQRVASRLQLAPEQRRSLILLVDHHMTMSNMAQQRNVDDPETIVEFAALIRTQKNLDGLMLLTLADGQGTSADNWSDWKESLVWHLYRATSQYLTDEAAFFEQRKIERESLQAAVAARFPTGYAEEIEAHFEFMPDNYFRGFGVEEIAAHIALFRRFLTRLFQHDAPNLPSAIEWEAYPQQGHSTASFCTWDGQDLLSKIAGSLSVVPLNILSADIYTRGDNLVLDVFRVCDLRGRAVTDSRDFELVENTLRMALENRRFDFRPQLEKARPRMLKRAGAEVEFPTTIGCDNGAHPNYTLIQIQTPDRLGLLYDLLSALGEEQISIALSRISTEKGAAIDTFYVVDGISRAKITDNTRIIAVQKRLQQAALGT
ncbi:MAG: [protein-PII] uridylyltransferase [Verrucomicrobiota bacterium]|nr:[protein-PII] uridylyltransferase [Verrucomicrobiota bacterium]